MEILVQGSFSDSKERIYGFRVRKIIGLRVSGLRVLGFLGLGFSILILMGTRGNLNFAYLPP